MTIPVPLSRAGMAYDGLCPCAPPARLQTACVFGAGNPEGSHFAHRLRRCIDNVQLLPIMGFKNHNTIAYLRMERKLNAFYQVFVDAILADSDFADGFRNAVGPGPVPDTGELAPPPMTVHR